MGYFRAVYVLAVVLFISSFASPAFGQSNKVERNGIWGGIGLGYGSLGCKYCDGRFSGLSGNLSLGGFASPHVALGLSTYGWTTIGDVARVSVGTLSPVLKIYPSKDPRKVSGLITVGVGAGYTSIDILNLSVISSIGPSAVLGLGVDIPAGPMNITLYANGVGMLLDDGSIMNFVQLGLGFSIYSTERKVSSGQRGRRPERVWEEYETPLSTRSSAQTGPQGGLSVSRNERSEDRGKNCQSQMRCVSDANCLGRDICESSTRTCLRMSCVEEGLQNSATVIGREVYKVAMGQIALVTRGQRRAQDRGGDNGNVSAQSMRPSLEERSTFSIREASKLCGVSEATIIGWIEEGLLRAIHVGDDYIISRQELRRTWRELGGGELFED